MMRLWTGFSSDEELGEVDATGLESCVSFPSRAWPVVGWVVDIPSEGSLRRGPSLVRAAALAASWFWVRTAVPADELRET